MEERKLTKADIDKVRHIEGFPMPITSAMSSNIKSSSGR